MCDHHHHHVGKCLETKTIGRKHARSPSVEEIPRPRQAPRQSSLFSGPYSPRSVHYAPGPARPTPGLRGSLANRSRQATPAGRSSLEARFSTPESVAAPPSSRSTPEAEVGTSEPTYKRNWGFIKYAAEAFEGHRFLSPCFTTLVTKTQPIFWTMRSCFYALSTFIEAAIGQAEAMVGSHELYETWRNDVSVLLVSHSCLRVGRSP
jgi:hypothetical protein